MLKHLVRAALLGLRRQSIIPTFRKVGGTFVRGVSVGLLFGIAGASACQAQCFAVASTPQYASGCAARAIPASKITEVGLGSNLPCCGRQLFYQLSLRAHTLRTGQGESRTTA